MNCAMPSAPARLTTPGRKLLSRQMIRVTNSTGRRAVCAERSIVRHTDWSRVSNAAGAASQGAAATAHITANIAAHHAGIIL